MILSVMVFVLALTGELQTRTYRADAQFETLEQCKAAGRDATARFTAIDGVVGAGFLCEAAPAV